jgi:hypothetical protein
VFYQAGLTEASANRFARPKEIRIVMDNAPPMTVTLEDRERQPQRLEFNQVETTVIKIDILSTYADAKFPFLTGFQEIEVYAGSLKIQGGSGEKTGSDVAETQPDEPPAGPESGAKDEVIKDVGDTIQAASDLIDSKEEPASPDGGEPAVSKDSSGDGLDPEERALLELLAEFTKKLEAYLKKK